MIQAGHVAAGRGGETEWEGKNQKEKKKFCILNTFLIFSFFYLGFSLIDKNKMWWQLKKISKPFLKYCHLFTMMVIVVSCQEICNHAIEYFSLYWYFIFTLMLVAKYDLY